MRIAGNGPSGTRLSSAHEPAAGGFGNDVAVADRRDRHDRPPVGEPEARERLGLDDSGQTAGQHDEREGHTDHRADGPGERQPLVPELEALVDVYVHGLRFRDSRESPSVGGLQEGIDPSDTSPSFNTRRPRWPQAVLRTTRRQEPAGRSGLLRFPVRIAAPRDAWTPHCLGALARAASAARNQ